jgi:hypothetical protein
MQTVLPRNNNDFAVDPLSSVATSIISRTKCVLPCDNPGTYGHSGRAGSGQPRFTITIGNNEAVMYNPNTGIQFDFTPSWYDTSKFIDVDANRALINKNLFPKLAPNFDQSITSIIRSATLRIPNGCIIEHVESANEWTNIRMEATQSSLRKEFDLMASSSWNKDPDKQKGLNPMLDGAWNNTTSTNSVAHGQTRRFIIPLCVLFDYARRYKITPLNLFRNGIQIDVELEDPYIAFVFDSCSSIPRGVAYPATPYRYFGGGDLIPQNVYDWFIGPGSVYMDGTTAVPAVVAPQNDATTAAHVYGVPPYWADNYASHENTDGGTALDTMRFFKNLLFIRQSLISEKLRSAIRRFQATDDNHEPSLDAIYPVGTTLGIPIQIYRHGSLAWRGFTAVARHFRIPTGFEEQPALAGQTVLFNPLLALSGVSINFQYVHAAPARTRTTLTNQLETAASYFTLPLYNWDHFSSGTHPGYGVNTIPFGVFRNVGDFPLFYADLANMEAEIRIDFDAAFLFNCDPTGAPGLTRCITTSTAVADPRVSVMSMWVKNLGQSPFQWSYTLNNISLLTDFIKPSADYVGKMISAFASETGIPYMVPRIYRIPRIISSPTAGLVQQVLPVQSRSVYFMVVILKDPLTENYQGDTVMQLPCLSSWQRRGLSRIDLVTGSTHKPDYVMQLDRKGGIEHIPEATNGLGSTFGDGMMPAFHRDALGPSREYLLCGNYDQTMANVITYFAARQTPSTAVQGYAPTSYGLAYADSSRAFIVISLAKRDMDNFVCGVDCSMSGSLTCNMYFGSDAAPTSAGESFDPGAGMQRSVLVRYYIGTHGALNLQKNANTYRN